MFLGATAKRLADPFVRLHANLCKFLELLGFRRDFKAAKARSAAETRRTAIHEAGHAVLLIALGLAFGGVSIIPDVRGGSDGRVYLPQPYRTAAKSALPWKAVCLRFAMACYAGEEAERQLIPTQPDPGEGASFDRRNAAELIGDHIGGDADSIELLFSLARRRCALLVDHYQPEIQALADALEVQPILSAKEARRVFMGSIAKRSARLLSFESDPTLHGLAGDKAFRVFLHSLNLPGRAN